MEHIHEFAIIFIVAICTFATRAFPFLIFGRSGEPSPTVKYLGLVLPPSVMAILIIYCLKNVQLTVLSSAAPSFLAIAIVIALHLWKRNNLLSIGLGTLSYMLMIQYLF